MTAGGGVLRHEETFVIIFSFWFHLLYRHNTHKCAHFPSCVQTCFSFHNRAKKWLCFEAGSMCFHLSHLLWEDARGTSQPHDMMQVKMLPWHTWAKYPRLSIWISCHLQPRQDWYKLDMYYHRHNHKMNASYLLHYQSVCWPTSTIWKIALCLLSISMSWSEENFVIGTFGISIFLSDWLFWAKKFYGQIWHFRQFSDFWLVGQSTTRCSQIPLTKCLPWFHISLICIYGQFDVSYCLNNNNKKTFPNLQQ